MRVFVEHCINTKDDARLESSLPVVTALAFKIQAAYNDLVGDIQAYEELRVHGAGEHGGEEEAREANEEARADREFVIGEMLKLAVHLDYADEIGRRKMFGLVRALWGHSRFSLTLTCVMRCCRGHDFARYAPRGPCSAMFGRAPGALAQ